MINLADPWTALQFDNAVVLIGTVIENAAQEQENIGSEKEPKWRLKYNMAQLLNSDFRLPAPAIEMQNEQQAQETFKGLPGIRVINRRGNS